MTSERYRLKHIARINARTLSEDTAQDLKFRYIDISAVGRGRLVAEPQLMQFGEAPSRARRLVSVGDTIISTVRTYLRAVLPITEHTDDLVVSTGFAVISPGPKVEPRFLAWWAQSNACVEEIVARSVGVSYPAVNAGDVGDLELRLPTLSEQKDIADLLDDETARTDALIQKKRRIAALAEERHAAAVDEILEEWPVTALRRIASRVDVGIAEATTHAYADDGIPLIRSTNIRMNELDLTDLLFVEPWFAERNRSKRLNTGDILTVRTGNAGVSAVVPSALDGAQCFTQLMTTLLPGHHPELICAALNATHARQYFGSQGWGSAQANISVPLLANAPVPSIPPEHQGIVLERLQREWNRSRRLLRLEQQHIELLRERRQALVTAAVTGQLDSAKAAA